MKILRWIRGIYRSMWWNQRALQLVEQGYDCDGSVGVMVKEMKAKGLKPGKDFVSVHGSVDIDGKLVRHECLDMYGHRVDGAAPSSTMVNAFVGATYVGTYR